MSFTTAEKRAIKKMLADGIAEGLATAVPEAIRINVNGKIDKMQSGLNTHNEKHENDMIRIMPVIEAYEEGQRDLETAKKGGRIVLWIATIITAIGGAWLVLKQLFPNIF